MMTTSAQPSRTSRGCFNVGKQLPALRSRWNPTPEQVTALEELYRTGLKTPTVQKIRQVTTELRSYGRIESKNVFYWFQNHRARERQKRRRQLMSVYQSDSKSPLQQRESSSVVQERMMSMVNGQNGTTSSDSNVSAELSCKEFFNFHRYYDYDCGMALSAPNLYKGEQQQEERREIQTLELFPLKSDNVKCAKETKLSITSKDATANFMSGDDTINFFEQTS